MLFAFRIYKTLRNGTTGSETTGKKVEGFENPVFQNSKNEENFIKRTSGKLDSKKLEVQSDTFKVI